MTQRSDEFEVMADILRPFAPEIEELKTTKIMDIKRLINELESRLKSSEKEEIELLKSGKDKDSIEYKKLINFGYRLGIKDALFLIDLINK